MTVYVDNVHIEAQVGRIHARWCHLTVGPFDDIAELHALARKIGLQRRWFQDKPWPRQHYDVTESKRQKAIEAGAVAITWEEGGRQRRAAATALRAIRVAAEADPPGWVAPAAEPVTYLHRVDAAVPHSLGGADPAYGRTVCGRPVIAGEGWTVVELRDSDPLCAACCHPAVQPAPQEVIEDVLF